MTPDARQVGDSLSFCQVASPLTPGAADVLQDRFAHQVETANCRGVVLCGWPARGLVCR